MKSIRTYAFLVCFLAVVCSCTGLFRDEIAELHNEIDDLKVEIGKINNSISALQTCITALENKDFVSSVTSIKDNGQVIGYTLHFDKSGDVTIYNGKDGYTPQIGLRTYSDGKWYWTLDGEWLKDEEGNMIRANGENGKDGSTGSDGITPKLKIENDVWWISYDEGKSWSQLGKAKGENGKDGDSVFQSIDVTNADYIVLTLIDGTVLSIPRYKPLSLVLETDSEDTGIGAGETIPIRYKISGGQSDLSITATSDGHYKTTLKRISDKEGVIYVTCPATYVDGYINIFVSDNDEHTIFKTISFSERTLRFKDGITYLIGPYGGNLTIPYSANFKYTLGFENGCDSWIRCLQTKSSEYFGNIVLTVSENNLENARNGVIDILPENNPTSPYMRLSIIQSSAYFTIDQSGFTVPSTGDEFSVNMTSSRGLKVETNNIDWLSYTMKEDGDHYTMVINVSKNNENEQRSAAITLLTADGTTVQGTILIRQLTKDMDATKDMVLEVSANAINRYTVYLPLVGECRCYVDWGDGTMEHIDAIINRNNSSQCISHTYAKTLKYYTVTIAGKVSGLCSSLMPDKNGIRKVLQWGDLGFIDIKDGFSDCSSLSEIADDTEGAFSRITSFYALFRNCTMLSAIPDNLFAHAEKADDFSSTFYGCKTISSIPEGLFSHNQLAKRISNTFNGCENLEHVPENLFLINSLVTDFSGTFRECLNLRSIPGSIFSHCPNVATFNSCFHTTPLNPIPTDIFDNNRRVLDFDGVFGWSHSQSYESPYTVIDGIKIHLYERYLNPDSFKTPTYYSNCFYTVEFTSGETIPLGWL